MLLTARIIRLRRKHETNNKNNYIGQETKDRSCLIKEAEKCFMKKMTFEISLEGCVSFHHKGEWMFMIEVTVFF